METLIKAGRMFYATAIAALGIQQFFYADFHPMLLPPIHNWIPALKVWAWLGGALLVAAAAAIIFEKKARTVSLILGGVLLGIFCFYYIPYEIIVDPYYKHLGSWGNAEKELALAGGAFVIAGSFQRDTVAGRQNKFPVILLEKLIPFGGIFFSITMISFGIDHFLYINNIATLVPGWIPFPVFWTYFAAVALIGSGLAIIFKIKLKVIASLLGIMILLWFIILHSPRALTNLFSENGNEVASAFSALAFSGIAFVIAGVQNRKQI